MGVHDIVSILNSPDSTCCGLDNSTMLKVYLAVAPAQVVFFSVVDHDAKSRAEDSVCSATIDDAF